MKYLKFEAFIRSIAFISCILLCVSLAACKSKEPSSDIPSEIQTSLGVPFDQLKSDMTNFVLKTYMPSEDDSKEEYIEDIVKYLSETEYNMLIADLGEYSKDIKTSIEDLKIQYGLAGNNTENKDKILITFYLHKSANGVEVRNRVNLVFSIQGSEITHHSVYMGVTEKRG